MSPRVCVLLEAQHPHVVRKNKRCSFCVFGEPGVEIAEHDCLAIAMLSGVANDLIPQKLLALLPRHAQPVSAELVIRSTGDVYAKHMQAEVYELDWEPALAV